MSFISKEERKYPCTHQTPRKTQEMTGLLFTTFALDFPPRRGRCIVSLSCDQAVSFCYPDKCQLTRLGCEKAPSLPDLCCSSSLSIGAGQGSASPHLRCACRLCLAPQSPRLLPKILQNPFSIYCFQILPAFFPSDPSSQLDSPGNGEVLASMLVAGR